MHLFSQRHGQSSHWSWSTLLVGCILGYVLTVSADLEPHWEVKANCAPYKSDLETAYNEHAAMVDSALKAIDAVARPRPGLLKQNDRRAWNRYAEMLAAMFGIKAGREEKDKGIKNGDIDTVRSLYQSMADAANNKPNPAISLLIHSLHCGTSSITYVAPDDIAPGANPDKKTLKELRPGGKEYTYGAFYFQDAKFLEIQEVDKDRTDPAEYFCPQGPLAFTIKAIAVVVFCDAGLTTGVKSVAAAKPQIKMLDPYMKWDQSIANTWVHEMAHMYGPGNLPDQQAVDERGAKLWIDEANNVPKKTYGFQSCVNLAKFFQPLALNTADTYSIFATTMYFDNFNWKLGFADSKFL
ncbi:MAG: hypothetical protein M1837_001362 [Sclerophora amabilis]|nr:MAG: hypothetical protein M1837_001362 [Sclerophora amabilis]